MVTAAWRWVEGLWAAGPQVEESLFFWRPRAVIFFRRIHDGHGVHYEGWDDTNTRRMFFECQQAYRLHERYVYVAATNPQAVDAACVPLREMHMNPIAFDVEK